MTHLRALPDMNAGTPLVDLLAVSPRAYTFEELAALSSARKARTAVAEGSVARLLPDTYVASMHQHSFHARADAALLWAGANAALSGVAAMFVWGFIDEPPDLIEIAVPHDERPRGPDWIRVRRLTWRPPTTRVRGFTVLSPPLAVVLGFGGLPRSSRTSVVYRAFRSGLVSAEGLSRTVKEVPRVAARRELERRIHSAIAGAESFLEEHSHRRVFHTAEFRGLTPQHQISVGREHFRIDLYDAETMTAIELDGEAYHSSPEQHLRDLHRDAVLASVGIQTVRLSYANLTSRPEWCRDVVRGVLAARGARTGARVRELPGPPSPVGQ